MTPLSIIENELNAPVHLDMVLEDMAIDSLEYIELIRRLEQEFKIEISSKELESVDTIGELCRVVYRLRKDIN